MRPSCRISARSLDFIEIVFEIEETFQIDLTVTIGNPQTVGKEQDKALSDFATVGDISQGGGRPWWLLRRRNEPGCRHWHGRGVADWTFP